MADGMTAVKKLVDILRMGSDYDCIMQWKGTEVPRGATIGGIEIGLIQHGMITGKNRERLGFYDSMREFAGPECDEHAILITTETPQEIIAPDSTVCDPGGESVLKKGRR